MRPSWLPPVWVRVWTLAQSTPPSGTQKPRVMPRSYGAPVSVAEGMRHWKKSRASATAPTGTSTAKVSTSSPRPS